MSVTAQAQLRILELSSGKRILQQKWTGTKTKNRLDGAIYELEVEEWCSIPVVKTIGGAIHDVLQKTEYSQSTYKITYKTDTKSATDCYSDGTTMLEAIERFLKTASNTTVLTKVELTLGP